MEIQTVKEYAIDNLISERTVYRRIISKQLPSYLHVKKLDKRGYVLWIDQCDLCISIEKACIEYNNRCGRAIRPDVAAELSIKYKINTAKLFRILGI